MIVFKERQLISETPEELVSFVRKFGKVLKLKEHMIIEDHISIESLDTRSKLIDGDYGIVVDESAINNLSLSE